MTSPPEPLIRPEEPGDEPKISSVHTCAFGRPNEGRLVDQLRAQLTGSSGFVSLVAELESCVVGHILLSPIRIVQDTGYIPALGLAPLAVQPEFQHSGIGCRLATTAIEHWRNTHTDYPVMVVLGHPDYYRRFGFQPAQQLGIRAPFEAPVEAFMAMLRDPHEPGDVGGVVEYPAAFDTV